MKPIYEENEETLEIAEQISCHIPPHLHKSMELVSVTEGIKPGVVCMERFWNPETLQTKTHGWMETNVNMLTKADAPFNDVVGTYTLRGFLVKVYPAKSAPEGIWQNPQDFSSWLAQPSDPTEEGTVQ